MFMLKRSSILAHRGLFLNNDERNTVSSLRRALDQGFGIETDIRDLDTRLVISHDPPSSENSVLTLEWLLQFVSLNRITGKIALNIKADGLTEQLCSLMVKYNVDPESLFVFDMSVPDGLSYLRKNIPTYGRVSEYESEPLSQKDICGIWVDNFTGAFPQVEAAQAFLDQGLRTALVSPELHGRDHRGLWSEMLDTGIYNHPLFELCTDFPVEAADLFSGAKSDD